MAGSIGSKALGTSVKSNTGWKTKKLLLEVIKPNNEDSIEATAEAIDKITYLQ